MSQDFWGQPSIIDQAPMPPALVNIASSTNASPTVITTSTPHGMQTGTAAVIFGHLVNTNADGLWIVTVLSATTFKISTFAGFATPTYINGNGVGGATGTVQSLMLPFVALPEDGVDDDKAATYNTPYEGLANMCAYLAVKVFANMTIVNGGLSSVASGGRSLFVPGARMNRLPTRLTDADHTVTAGTDGPIIILAKPTTARTITISQASDKFKQDGDTLEFYMPIPGSDAASDYWILKREGSANNIAILFGRYQVAVTTDTYPAFARVHLEGGVWRLTGGAGVNFDTDA